MKRLGKIQYLIGTRNSMTRVVDTIKVVELLEKEISGSTLGHVQNELFVDPNKIFAIAAFLKDHEGLEFGFLTSITAVDYIEYFQIVYHLLSMKFNHSLILKTNLYDRTNPSIQSLISVWKGADLQEREIWDLFGIKFNDHPNMKRVLLWEGFEGHPLRKDFLGQEEQKT